MRKCFLEGFGSCRGKLTREHYISETVLDAIGPDGSLEVGGIAKWPAGELRKVGIGSLTSKTLCSAHNSGLSDLDRTAGALIRTLDAVDKDWSSLPPITRLPGKSIERWLLKVLCGLASANAFGNNEIPDDWKRLLVGDFWPAKWGLYLPSASGTAVLAKEFSVDTLVHATTGHIKAARFRLAGVHFALVLGRPDDQKAWGHHRPGGIIFERLGENRKLEFVWRKRSETMVIYTATGRTSRDVPQWKGWTRSEV